VRKDKSSRFLCITGNQEHKYREWRESKKINERAKSRNLNTTVHIIDADGSWWS